MTSQSLRSGLRQKRDAARHPLNGKISVPHAYLLPHGSSIMAHPFLLLCVLCASGLSPFPARTREALNRSPSLKILRKKSRLASCQTAFCGPRYREYLPGARRGGRGSLYRRSCSCMLTRISNDSRAFRGCHASFPTRRAEACFALRGQSMAPACRPIAIRITSSMSTSQFPGAGAGRGVCGARKLIPMPQKISCALPSPTTGIRGLPPSASGYHPNLDPSSSPCCLDAVRVTPNYPEG